MFLHSHFFRVWIWICSSFVIVIPVAVQGQIVPEQTITNTRVQLNGAGDRLTIDQGTLSSDQTNLFHHFEQFDLPTESTATFDLRANDFDNVRNILNRVTQGNPSEINGLLEVLGGNNPNLYLLNPSGIIFGSQASLNIPADFTASTASQLDFGNNSWLESSQTSDYSNFDGLPTAFGFDATNSAVINAADLAVGTDQNLNFLAATVINTGTLSAPSGSITVTAVPGENTVRLSQPGSLLSLEFDPSLNGSTSISALDLADLLTDIDPAISGVDFELGLAIENGLIKTDSGIILPSETGLFINEGNLNLGSGSLNVIGNKIGFLAGEITGKNLNFQATESFFAAPATNFIATNGDISIDADQINIYGELTTGSLVLDAGDGLEITSVPTTQTWAIAANELEIVAGSGTITANLATPFDRDLTTTTLGSNWLSATLAQGDGAIATKIGNLTLGSPLNINGIISGSLGLDAAQDLIINGAIADSTNQGDALNLNLSAQNNIEINQSISTGGGDLFVKAETGQILLKNDLNIGTGTALFFDDVRISNVSLFGGLGSRVEFQGTVNSNNNLNASNLAISATEIEFTEQVGSDAALNNLSLIADQVTFNKNIFARGDISFAPQNNNLDLTIGGNIADARLNLTNSDLDKLQNGFSEITFSGKNITLFKDLEFDRDLILNAATGTVNTNSFSLNAPNISIFAATNFNFDRVTANNLFLQTKGNITDSGSLNIQDLLTLETDGAIALDNGANDFNRVKIQKANDVLLRDVDDLTLLTSNISGSLDIQAGNFTTDTAINIGKDLKIATTEIIATKALIAAGKVELSSQNASIKTGNISATNGSLNMTALSKIETDDIFGSGAVQLTSQGSFINSKNITSSTSTVDLSAATGITATNISANNAVGLTSQNSSINTQNITSNTSAVNLLATGGITTNNISANDAVRLTSQSSINTQNITSNMSTVDLSATAGITATNISANDAVRLTSQGSSINTQDVVSNASAVVLAAARDITSKQISAKGVVNLTSGNSMATGDITALGQDITLKAGNKIKTGNLTTRSNTQSAGDVVVEAVRAIATGNIDTSSTIRNAGNVTLDPLEDIDVGYINAEAMLGIGGDVTMTADRHVRLNNTFQAASRDDASISTIGGIKSGEITINHGGGKQQPFQVGNPQVNGSAGKLVQGDITIPTGAQFAEKIDTEEIKEFRPNDFPQTINPNNLASQVEGLSADFFRNVQVEELAITEAELTNVERRFADDYIERFNLQQQDTRPTAEVSETLQNIQAQTNVVPAIVYAFFRPAGDAPERGDESEVQWQLNPQGRWQYQDAPAGNASDELELVMVKADGTKIRKRIHGATREEVIFLANRFFSHVTNLRLRKAYYYSASSLYDILVKPLEEEMKAAGVTNLTYIMDSGLRVLPLAALYDQEEQEFLIEKYSVGIMPSFDLTDTRYQSLRANAVLAMGSSTFEEQNALPSVPVELARIQAQVPGGEMFLNENFTVENLLTARQNNPYSIVHLATHGEFLSGTLDNSYIQFWDERISLADFSQLQLDEPPVSLLVLSACRTALGNRDAELGFAGLAIASGAKSVLGSLWYVSDAGTLELMTEFYRALQTTTVKAEALRQAQLAMLRGDVTSKKGTVAFSRGGTAIEPLPHIPPDVPVVQVQDFSHPYYWSAFSLIGNPW